MTKNNSKHITKQNKTNKKHHNKSYPKLAFIMVLIFVIFIIILIKNKTINLNYENTQIILNNENITSKLEQNIILENNNIYMSFSDIKSFIDTTIYEDETGLIITASDKKIASLRKDEENITINGSNQIINKPIIEKDGQIYIAISELESVYDYEFEYIESTNIVTIDHLSKKCVKAYAKKNIKIKEEQKAFSKIIEKVKKGNWIFYLSEENGIAKVRTQNGNIGFVKSKLLDNFVTEREDLNDDINQNLDNALEYDITSKDITSFEKRQEVINLILQEAIKSDRMYVKIIYNGERNSFFERFKIEVLPILKECGITVNI